MDTVKSERTSNDLVIQGILKEAFFTGADFFITNESRDHQFKIFDISESKIRADSSSKRLYFSSFEQDLNLKNDHKYSFYSKFHRYTITGVLELESQTSQAASSGDRRLWVFKFPSELSLENLRKSDRNRIRQELQKPIAVFLRSFSLHSEGSFIIEDVSFDGFGGELWVQNGFPIDSETSINGILEKEGEVVEIHGVVLNARLLPSDKNGFDHYKIGIRQLDSKSPERNKSKAERRAQSRYPTHLQLQLESVLFSEQSLTLNVDDVSVNGFSGTPATGVVFSPVPIGSVFQIKGEKTKLKLVHFKEERFHFYVQRRSLEDGIEWLKKMTPAIDPGARCSTKDAKELYRIFLQAGAVSTQYLKRHQLHQDLLVSKHSDINESAYLHRWFLGGQPHEADAYISALRIGNTSWVMGDIAKTNDSDLDVKKSVRSFFTSFAEFSSQSPCIGTLAIIWVKDHPFWKRWNDSISAHHPELIASKVKMDYFRLSKSDQSADVDILYKVIEKNDPVSRSRIIKSLSENVARFVQHAFDFCETGVGSYAFEGSCDWFSRRYVSLKVKNTEFLVLFSSSAPGISINRFLDSLFLVPLNSDYLRLSEEEINRIAGVLSADFKIFFASVRVVHDFEKGLTETEMDALLMYPEAFRLFST